ncbi:MAG: ComF family protein [Ghiorsea sp.]|nr:ComF family protein [Ghiorsea sp.]
MRLLQQLQPYIFPPACPTCKKVHVTRAINTKPANINLAEQYDCCADCLQNIHLAQISTCYHCGITLPESLAPGPCGHCLTQPPPQQHTRNVFVYRDTVRTALLAWKLQGQSTGLHWLLQSSTPTLQQIFSPNDLLIPVPMPLSRMRRSGLHHSADLCQRIAQITSSQVCHTLLRRTGNHTRQSSLKGKQRLSNLRKAFMLTNDYQTQLDKYNVQGKIWVVDDILTTGATLRHACKVMKKTQHPIFAFALARTPSNT